MFLDSENTKTYILIPKVHENIEKYENQIRYKDFRSFSLFRYFRNYKIRKNTIHA